MSAPRPLPPLGPIRQVGYVVDDLTASVQQWLRGAGLGPWVCFRNVVMQAHYRGRPGTVRMDVALGYQGELEIELIQPTSFEGSPYVDAAGRPATGPNHLAWFTDDIDAEIARAPARGLEVVFTASNPVTRVAYLEPPGDPGTRYELIQYSADGLAGWRERVQAARDWDGTNPVLEVDLAQFGA